MLAHYHITRADPCEPHWPNGSWSVHRITGDQIAERVVRERVKVPSDGPAYYEGKVIARHSWCGYLGMAHTFEGVREMIERDQADQAALAKREPQIPDQSRLWDIVGMVQTVVRMRGPHGDQALKAAIGEALTDIMALLPYCPESDRGAVRRELLRRFGV